LSVNPFSTWRECIYGECTHEQHVRRTLTLTHTITAYRVSGNVVRVRILICATGQKPCRKRVYLNCLGFSDRRSDFINFELHIRSDRHRRSGVRCTNNDPYGSIPLTLNSAPNIMQRYAPPRALHSEHSCLPKGITTLCCQLYAINLFLDCLSVCPLLLCYIPYKRRIIK